jgi:hypothetical protein
MEVAEVPTEPTRITDQLKTKGFAVPANVPDGYFTEQTLSAFLGAGKPGPSTRTLRRWNELGIGPPRIAFRKTILYKLESVIKWLEQCESKPVRGGRAR